MLKSIKFCNFKKEKIGCFTKYFKDGSFKIWLFVILYGNLFFKIIYVAISQILKFVILETKGTVLLLLGLASIK